MFRNYRESGNIIKMSPTLGLRCVNAEQKPLSNTCKDFKVRFLFEKEIKADYSGIEWFDRDDPSATNEILEWIRKDNPGKVPCKVPVAIEAKLVDGR